LPEDVASVGIAGLMADADATGGMVAFITVAALRRYPCRGPGHAMAVGGIGSATVSDSAGVFATDSRSAKGGYQANGYFY